MLQLKLAVHRNTSASLRAQQQHASAERAPSVCVVQVFAVLLCGNYELCITGYVACDAGASLPADHQQRLTAHCGPAALHFTQGGYQGASDGIRAGYWVWV